MTERAATNLPNILLIMTDQPYCAIGPWSPSRPAALQLLFVKWRDGFEELYDYDDDPHVYTGRVNTSREQRHVNMLRQRLLAMRIAAGDQCWALKTT